MIPTSNGQVVACTETVRPSLISSVHTWPVNPESRHVVGIRQSNRFTESCELCPEFGRLGTSFCENAQWKLVEIGVGSSIAPVHNPENGCRSRRGWTLYNLKTVKYGSRRPAFPSDPGLQTLIPRRQRRRKESNCPWWQLVPQGSHSMENIPEPLRTWTIYTMKCAAGTPVFSLSFDLLISLNVNQSQHCQSRSGNG